MFTGLVEELGVVVDCSTEAAGIRFRVQAKTCSQDLSPGDSIAVNGVCQTVVAREDTEFEVVAIPETLSRTTFGTLRKDAKVNLERPLRMGDRLGGHWVSGHVDACGRIVAFDEISGGRSFQISTDALYETLLVEKGSITVDGVSLTVGRIDDAEPTRAEGEVDGIDGSGTHSVASDSDPSRATLFWVHIIPETWERTLFGSYAVGDHVNLEFDLLGKYILRAQDLGSVRERSGS